MVKKIKGLILFANPNKTFPIQSSREKQIIQEALGSAKYKDNLEVAFIEASTIHDLRRSLLNEEFNIVHISSHGTQNGLILQDEYGEPLLIEPQALADWLQKYQSLECLILNACHSISQGRLTSLSVPYTIAMEGSITDKAAIEFSRGFYDAVGALKDYEFAYLEGCQNVELCFPGTNFRAEIIKRGEYSRDVSYMTDETPPAAATDEIKTFTNIWYAKKKYSFWSVFRNTEVGTLIVYDDYLEFKGSKSNVRIEEISGVKHMKMGGDINNNWVEITYRKENLTSSVYFADASNLGIGNLIGGSGRLFDVLYRQFQRFHSGKESANSAKQAANSADDSKPPRENKFDVKGKGNFTAGGNIENNTIYSGDVTINDSGKK
jgi:hypothetical protein